MNNVGITADKTMLQELSSNDAAASWQSQCIVALLRLLGVKRKLVSAAAVQKRVRQLALKPASYTPKGQGPGVNLSLEDVSGWPVYHMEPAGYPDSKNTVVFLHGGGYINEIVPAHWRFLGQLVREARVRCIVPIYPVAPRGRAGEIVPAAGRMLQQLLTGDTSRQITVIGNSAGAGMTLAAAQWLRDAGYPQPQQLVLVSPGVDASLNTAEHISVAAHDPVLDIPGIREGARLYAGDLDMAHPYVSPLNGDFHGLAPMIIFSGMLDLLYPDSIRLAAKARAAGVAVELHLRKGQPHNYAAMPTPEGRQARAIIVRALTENKMNTFETSEP